MSEPEQSGEARLVGLPPIVDAAARVLILGSFPSEASLAAQHYYGHPQNQFWRLVGACIGAPLIDFDYAQKRRALLAHGVAVWDVYGLCRREGSLDTAIREARPNDFASLLRRARRLERICFNGKTAGRFQQHFAAQGFATCVLPSSSPAYTLSFEKKLQIWREALSR